MNCQDEQKVFKPHLYRMGSLRKMGANISFILENSSGEDINITAINDLSFSGHFIAKDNFVFLSVSKEVRKPEDITPQSPLVLKQNVPFQVIVRDFQPSAAMTNLRLLFLAKCLGEVIVDVNDSIR